MGLTPESLGLLTLPRLRIQGANAVSSPLTWGFPSLTAFLGLMWALERKTCSECGLSFHGVGVICHAFEPLIFKSGDRCIFRLTRNPMKNHKKMASIVEEGRAHMEISLIFDVGGQGMEKPEEELRRTAATIQDILFGMRVAGGSVLPPQGKSPPPRLELIRSDPVGQFKELRRVSRLLPGFALVSRQDLLEERLAELRAENLVVTLLDAMLDFSRLNFAADPDAAVREGVVPWRQVRINKGWVVPIPVGYAALSELYPAGSVKNARAADTPFRFVESLYSLGEWKSAHRLDKIRDLLWYAKHDAADGLYLCQNDFTPPLKGE